MANPEFFKQEFLKHAVDGFIGDPNGEPAYGYVRVSSKGQAEEGRSGLPRQIEHIHEKALLEHYKVSWEMLFADDHTGFEFEDRPQLQILLRECKQSNTRRASAILFENIDRLSRNADWHQGYLFEQFSKKFDMKVFFWKDPGNRITRMVLGAAAQDNMEDAKERMRIGTLKKLQDGRVTAKRPAYGYQFVDSNGDPNGARVKHDTHYGIVEKNAEVVRIIFIKIAEGMSLRGLCYYLHSLYPPPGNSSNWGQQFLSKLIKNEVYKGLFIGNRYKVVKMEQVRSGGKLTNEPPKMKKVLAERPKEEWIYVNVPAIVSEALWQKANDMLIKNSIVSPRNSKNNYLLTGLMKCADCGHTYIGQMIKNKNGKNKSVTKKTVYRCSSKFRPKAIRDALGCTQKAIHASKIEKGIWEIVCNVMTDPKPMLQALDDLYQGETNENIASQIKHIENQIESCDIEDSKVKKGYVAGVYSEDEAIEERALIRKKRETLMESLEKMQVKLITREQYLEQKEMILGMVQKFREKKIDLNAPFELKRALVKTIINKIVLNTSSQSFEITGIFEGTWSFSDDNIESASAGGYGLNIAWKTKHYFDKPDVLSLFIVSSDSFLADSAMQSRSKRKAVI